MLLVKVIRESYRIGQKAIRIDRGVCEDIDTNRTFPHFAKPVYVRAMKTKSALPPTTVGDRPRRSFETSQKKDRDAIDAAFKKLIGEDGFRAHGAFGRRKVSS